MIQTQTGIKVRIPILDLHLAAFQALNGNPPELSLQGTRVIFLFRPDATFNRLAEQFNSNASVPCLDYVNAFRQLKAMMITKRNAAEGGGR